MNQQERGSQSVVEDVEPETREVYNQIRAGSFSPAQLQLLFDRDKIAEGFLNTKGFERRLNRYLEAGIKGVLIAVDVDDFKLFNDSQGHPAGDLLLSKAARVLLEETRSSEPAMVQQEHRHHRNEKRDLLGRVGGDEFLIFLAGASLADAIKAALRIRQHLARVVRQYFPDYGPDQTMSLGLTPLRPDDSGQTFRERADRALYLAKTGKGNGKIEDSVAIL